MSDNTQPLWLLRLSHGWFLAGIIRGNIHLWLHRTILPGVVEYGEIFTTTEEEAGSRRLVLARDLIDSDIADFVKDENNPEVRLRILSPRGVRAWIRRAVPAVFGEDYPPKAVMYFEEVHDVLRHRIEPIHPDWYVKTPEA